MTKTIDGKTYRSHTAQVIFSLPCPFPPTDPKWHETRVHRTQRGAYFLSGKGGFRSRWAKQTRQETISGEGIEVITKEEARAYAIQLGVSPDYFARMGFHRMEDEGL